MDEGGGEPEGLGTATEVGSWGALVLTLEGQVGAASEE